MRNIVFLAQCYLPSKHTSTIFFPLCSHCYFQPIGHYTLGGIYLTAGDLVATNLHLRVSLHIQPNFAHALATLKLVRCSLKFKEEQKVLEQKVCMCVYVSLSLFLCVCIGVSWWLGGQTTCLLTIG